MWWLDTQADTGRWSFCNYNDNGIGFPRDCGKNGAVGGQWNSLTKGGHDVTWTIWRANKDDSNDNSNDDSNDDSNDNNDDNAGTFFPLAS